jgi:hypothetical protein
MPVNNFRDDTFGVKEGGGGGGGGGIDTVEQLEQQRQDTIRRLEPTWQREIAALGLFMSAAAINEQMNLEGQRDAGQSYNATRLTQLENASQQEYNTFSGGGGNWLHRGDATERNDRRTIHQDYHNRRARELRRLQGGG